MKFTGYHARVGQIHIDQAFGMFHDIVAKLDEGINHCNEDIKLHEQIIVDNKAKAEALAAQVGKAYKLKGKIQAIVE